jgi:hypothetical protein
MASEKVHIECANRTQLTLRQLLADKETHSPWIAVTAFYKALHVVEAVFANDKSIRHTSDHSARERALKTVRRYEHIYKNYSHLYRASINARYLPHHACFDDFLSPDQVVDQLLKHYLRQVEATVRKLLTAPDVLVGIEAALS